ncbi:MAG TPA: 50S ribosomal protein L3 [bacterium]|nr:50S ribosomal protein L3 [bacterium]HNS49298.1 50S ribosomal protein L3 [bacterium]
MALGIIGRKVGMTRIFNADGRTVPVTVVQAGPCPVVARREPGNGGYASLQLGYGAGRKVSKPLAGHFKKAGLAPTRILKEFRVSNEQMEKFPSGSQVTVEIFEVGERVAVTGRTIGKGFQGVVKRHGFKGGAATHGSMSHRAPGSIGGSNPDRVTKGHRMGGRMGGVNLTVRGLEVVGIDKEKNLLLLKGAVPGAEDGLLQVKKIKG